MNLPHLTFETFDGVDIAVADYRGCAPGEFLRRLAAVSDWVVQQPPRSVRMITIAAGVGYSPEGMRDLVSMLRVTRPHMKASAVVGLGHLTLVVRVINHLSGRSLQAFETLDDARRWLAAAARERESEPIAFG